MKKTIIFFLILSFAFITIGLPLHYMNLKNPEKTRFIKDLIPNQFKSFLKKTFFFIPEYIRQHELLLGYYKKGQILEQKLDKVMQKKDMVNEEIFPQTQFMKINYKEILVDGLDKRDSFLNPSDKKNSPFYIETLNEKTILIAANGAALFYETPKLLGKEKLDKFEIKNNLPENITVTDSLVFKNQIFVAFVNQNKACDSMEIFYAEINLDFLNFKEFYLQGSIGECYNEMPLGGRMAVYDDAGHPSILISIKDINKKNYFLLDQYNKNLEYKFCIILLIDIKTKETRPITSGHRNPHGLLVNEKNIILSTEHGPRGGDEVNKIVEGKNYGWPLASYGENYKDNLDAADKFSFKKNHSQYGFKEPIYSFVPSIAISQIIQVPEEFSSRWQNSYLITSLKGLSIYRVVFDENYSRIITMEKIKIGKRIRDISYNKKYNCFFLALENESGSIGVFRAD